MYVVEETLQLLMLGVEYTLQVKTPYNREIHHFKSITKQKNITNKNLIKFINQSNQNLNKSKKPKIEKFKGKVEKASFTNNNKNIDDIRSLTVIESFS
jgi:hypothetical protein